MRATHLSPFPRRGGALIIAILFMGAITAGFTIWIGLIRQRARVADFEDHHVRKRLAALNAEILVRDYLLRRVMASNGDIDGLSTNTDSGNTWSTTVASSWNNVSRATTPIWAGYSMNSSTKLAGLNAFSPTFDYPYSKSLIFTTSYKQLFYNDNGAATTNPGIAQYSNDTTTIRGFVRSINPLLAGDLLVLHRPNLIATTLPSVTGNVVVNGRVVHFTPDIAAASYTARSQRYTSSIISGTSFPYSISIAPSDLAGSAIMPSNLPWIPYSSGNISGSNLESVASGTDWRFSDFEGRLNFIDPGTSNSSNSLRTTLTAISSTIQASGTTTSSDSRGFSLNGTTGYADITPCISSAVADLPSIIITDGLTALDIQGQDDTTFSNYAPYRPALAVMYTQASTGRDLTTIRLRFNNSRRLLLALKKDPRPGGFAPPVNLVIDNPDRPSAQYHICIIAENVPLTITTTSATSINLTGGIETNSSIIFPASPTLTTINLQTDTRGLIRLAPRLSWVETYLTNKL